MTSAAKQQQRTRYDLDLINFHHPNFSERDPSPPEPSFGGIGGPPHTHPEFALQPERALCFFAELEVNSVTDELAAGSSLRECEQELQKIELLARDKL